MPPSSLQVGAERTRSAQAAGGGPRRRRASAAQAPQRPLLGMATILAPPAIIKLASPPGCDGPGSPPPSCARHFLVSTPVAASGQGPPLLGLPDQGKHFFPYLLGGAVLLCVCAIMAMQLWHSIGGAARDAAAAAEAGEGTPLTAARPAHQQAALKRRL